MKKGRREEVATTSKDEKVLTNGMGGIDNKGCVSAGWKEEMINQRCVDMLRWMVGRA